MAMAGEWVKMRVSLRDHPKVIQLAHMIGESHEAAAALSRDHVTPLRECVTFAVTRDVTISSLLRFWGAANEHTKDGVLAGVKLHYLDEMAGVPGFGRMLEAVGWAEFRDDLGAVVLPNFTEFNTPAKGGRALTGAERMKRSRAKKKAEEEKTREETVTCDIEKRESVTCDVTCDDSCATRDIIRDDWRLRGDEIERGESDTKSRESSRPVSNPRESSRILANPPDDFVDHEPGAPSAADMLEFLAHWQKLPDGLGGVIRIAGLPTTIKPDDFTALASLSQRDKAAIKEIWPHRKEAVLVAFENIRTRNVGQWRQAMQIRHFVDALDALYAGEEKTKRVYSAPQKPTHSEKIVGSARSMLEMGDFFSDSLGNQTVIEGSIDQRKALT
jgi:hypothetical protein